MSNTVNPNYDEPGAKKLNRGQIITVWVGLCGATLGCSAWVLAMAAMGGDWTAFGLTIALNVILIVAFGKLSLRHPTWRFPLLASLIILVTGECLALYWWRFELWRGIGAITPEALVNEKKTVTLTIVAMVGIVLAQFVVVYLLQMNTRKNRRKMREKLSNGG